MKHPETLALHAGWRADPATHAVAPPIYQTTSFQFRDTEHAANLFGLKELGNIYSRIMNPTCDALEQRMAALEGGAAALAVSSGQAASALAIQNICRTGDNIVSSTDLYGGTWNLFAHTFKAMGIEVRFVDPADPQAFRAATDARTRAYYAETLPNPKLAVFPIGEVAAIGRELGVPLIMDNTAAPVISRPLDHGAAIVVYSTTKYIGGHGTSIGGMIVDGGKFDWAAHGERFPMLTRPDPSYHGAIWTEAAKPLGPIAYILKARVTLQRDLGMSMSPFNAFSSCRGSKRYPCACASIAATARRSRAYLASAAISRVIYPGFGQSPECQARPALFERRQWRACRVRDQAGGGGPAFHRFAQDDLSCRQYRRCAHAAIHPASTTHSQLSEAEQRATGVTPGYMRLSVGIEQIEDIIGDISQALERRAAH